MHVDGAGSVWWYTAEDDRVYQLDGKRFCYRGHLDKVAAQSGLFTGTGKSGRKWRGGLAWRGGRWSSEPFPGLPDCYVADSGSVPLDAEGNLWAVIVELHEPEGEIDRHPPFLAETIAVYDGRKWRSRPPEPIKGMFELPSLVSDPHGRVWTRIGSRLYCCERGHWRRVAFDPGWEVDMGSVTFDQTGVLWAWTGDRIARFDGRRTDRWGKREGLAMGPMEGIEEVVPDHSGGALFVTTDRLGLVFQGRVSYLAPPGRLPGRPLDLVADRVGRVWVLWDGGGSGCFDGRTWRVSFETLKEDVPSEYFGGTSAPEAGLQYLALDDRGRLCVGGPEQHVHFLVDGGWYTLRRPQPESTRVHDLACSAAGCVWLATEVGPIAWTGQSWEPSRDQGGPFEAMWHVLIDGRHRPWFAGGEAVFVLDRGKWKRHDLRLDGRTITGMAFDKRGRLPVGSDDAGLRMYDGQAWTTYDAADGLVSSNVTAIACDRKGRVGVGSDKGLSVLTRGKWRIVPDEGRSLSLSRGLGSLVVDSRGWVWVTTPLGLMVLTGNSWETDTPANAGQGGGT